MRQDVVGPVEELLPRVTQVAEEVSGRSASDPDTPLDLDSLGQAELAFALEEAFRLRLADDSALRTPWEAAVAVAAALRGDGSGAEPPLPQGIGHLQWLSEAVLGPILRPYLRLRVVGADRVPAAGAAVLASNHDSALDIPLLAMASPRRVWFMAKHELFEGRFGAWFFHALGGFPVRREGPDLRAIRAALAVANSGMPLGMYPEGTRSHDFLPFLPGAAWVSVATGAPLIPVAVRGTAEAMPRGAVLPRRVQVRLAFGEPIDLGREDDPRARLRRAAEATKELQSEVERLMR